MSFLSMLGGRLRVAGCGGPLVVSDSADDPCCCNECSPTCQISQSGLLDPENNGWSIKDINDLPKTLPISVTFKYEDSSVSQCGGNNPNQQVGNISCCFFLNEDTNVEISVSGTVERQTAVNFDKGTLTLAGVEAKIFSFGDSQNTCSMKSTADSQTVFLTAGVHNYTLSADTGDEKWHNNMTHLFSIKKA